MSALLHQKRKIIANFDNLRGLTYDTILGGPLPPRHYRILFNIPPVFAF
jgi:hypothetical protein